MKSRAVTKNNDVKCDVCGADIVLNGRKIKEFHFPDGIFIRYFGCGQCGAKYTIIVTDAELRKDIRRRGFQSSSEIMKLRYAELKMKYAERVKELP